jgi:hypothetical protein
MIGANYCSRPAVVLKCNVRDHLADGIVWPECNNENSRLTNVLECFAKCYRMEVWAMLSKKFLLNKILLLGFVNPKTRVEDDR